MKPLNLITRLYSHLIKDKIKLNLHYQNFNKKNRKTLKFKTEN